MSGEYCAHHECKSSKYVGCELWGHCLVHRQHKLVLLAYLRSFIVDERPFRTQRKPQRTLISVHAIVRSLFALHFARSFELREAIGFVKVQKWFRGPSMWCQTSNSYHRMWLSTSSLRCAQYVHHVNCNKIFKITNQLPVSSTSNVKIYFHFCHFSTKLCWHIRESTRAYVKKSSYLKLHNIF